MRIVSLLPSATEIAFALGLGDQIEAVTFECDHPAEARSKPIVSTSALPQDRRLSPGEVDRLVGERMAAHQPLYGLDRDLIRRIDPDLILTQDLCRVCAIPSGQVREAIADLGTGARVLSLDPTTLQGVLDSVLAVGEATKVADRAEALVAELRSRIDRVRRTASVLPSFRTLCLEWSDPPVAGGHWVPDMVEIAGGANLLSTAGEPSRRIAWRDVAAALPEVVVFMPCGYYLDEAEDEAGALLGIPDFAETPAARTGLVFAVDATSYFSRPGPRLVDGLEILAWAIHPDVFPEPPPDRVVRASR